MKQGATKLYAMHIISLVLKEPCDRYTYFWLGTHKAAGVSARFEGPAGCFLESWVVWLALNILELLHQLLASLLS